MEGKVFGSLTVIHEVETSKPSRYYLCRCECGKEKEVRGTALRSGHTKSCGCQQMSGMRAGYKKPNDLTGKTFGMLTALHIVDADVKGKSKGVRWRCLCDCGNFVTVRGGLLISGNNKSCGCVQNPARDITGQRFGKLVAIQRTVARSGNAYFWLCRCDCGELHSVPINSLSSGNAKSCGCVKSQPEDLSGLRFGNLTAVKMVDKRYSTDRTRWVCQCDCGGAKTVAATSLKSGKAKSCGCARNKSRPLAA